MQRRSDVRGIRHRHVARHTGQDPRLELRHVGDALGIAANLAAVWHAREPADLAPDVQDTIRIVYHCGGRAPEKIAVRQRAILGGRGPGP